MDDPSSQPSHEWMAHLHGAKLWERLDKVALDCLAADPEDAVAHYHRAWAMVKLKRFKEMEAHVDFLLSKNPEGVAALQLAGLWHVSMGRPKKAQLYLSSALAISPEWGMLWHCAACVELKLGHLKKSQEYSARARELDPDNADIAQFSIQLANMENTSAASSLAEIREYEEALALNPECANLLASIGNVYLLNLEMPEKAEEYYRRALWIDPMNKRYQRWLWRSIQAQNLWFRTLRLPMAGMVYVRRLRLALKLRPWVIVLYFLFPYFVVAFALWLGLAFVILGPAAWCVEWLLLADIQRASRMADRLGNWWLRFHQMSFWIRLSACFAVIIGFWATVFHVLGVAMLPGFFLIVIFFVVNFVLLGINIGIRRQNTKVSCQEFSADQAALKMPDVNEG